MSRTSAGGPQTGANRKTPRVRTMKYVNREKCRDIGRVRSILAHMNSHSDEHYMLVVSSPDPRKHLSFFGSKPLIRAALSSQFRNHILHDPVEGKEVMYVPFVRDITAEEVEKLSETQLGVGISHMMDLFNYPTKQHYVFKKNKADIGMSCEKPKPLFWHPLIRFLNFQAAETDSFVEPEFAHTTTVRSKKEAMRLVFSHMLAYYKRVIERLYNENQDSDVDMMGLKGVVGGDELTFMGDNDIENDVSLDVDGDDDENDEEFINVDDSLPVKPQSQGKKRRASMTEQDQGIPSSHREYKFSARNEASLQHVYPSTSSAHHGEQPRIRLRLNEPHVLQSDSPRGSPMLGTHQRNLQSKNVSREQNVYRMINRCICAAEVDKNGVVETGPDGKLFKYFNGAYRVFYAGRQTTHFVAIGRNGLVHDCGMFGTIVLSDDLEQEQDPSLHEYLRGDDGLSETSGDVLVMGFEPQGAYNEQVVRDLECSPVPNG